MSDSFNRLFRWTMDDVRRAIREAEDRAFLYGSAVQPYDFKPGDGLRIIAYPAVPDDGLFVVSRVDQGIDFKTLSLDIKNNTVPVTPKCGCGADAWIKDRGADYCAKCFRLLLATGKNEFIVKLDDGRWQVSASPPQLRPGQSVAGPDGVGGLASDGTPWAKQYDPKADLGPALEKIQREAQAALANGSIGRHYRSRQELHGGTTVEESLDGVNWTVVYSMCAGCGTTVAGPLPAGRCPNCPLAVEERVKLLTEDQREALLTAARLTTQVKKLVAEAKEIRRAELLPEVPHEVLGFRFWAINTENWRLTGTGVGGDWDPIPEDGVFRAVCNYCHQPAPCDLHDDSGFNIYTSTETMDYHPGTMGKGYRVAGAVLAWTDTDRFFVHSEYSYRQDLGLTLGFRAECVKVAVLVADGPKPRRRLIEAVAEEYGAMTCPGDRLAEVAREFGDPLPEDVARWAAGDETAWPGVDPRVQQTYDQMMVAAENLLAQVRDYCRAAAGDQLTPEEIVRLIGAEDEDSGPPI